MFEIVDAIEPSVEEPGIARMEEDDGLVMTAAKIEEMVCESRAGDLAGGGDEGEGCRADKAIDGDGDAALGNGALEEEPGDMDAVIYRTIEDGGIDAGGEIVALALGPFAIAIDGRSLIERKIWDINARVIGSIYSKFCASAGVPGDILGNHKGEIAIVAGGVGALVTEDEGERGWEVGGHCGEGRRFDRLRAFCKFKSGFARGGLGWEGLRQEFAGEVEFELGGYFLSCAPEEAGEGEAGA